MGWLFSGRWPNKAALVEHLTTGNGLKTLKHCCVGNNLWCVHEGERSGGRGTIRFICLYLMKGPTTDRGYSGNDKDWWGYKDVDETAGPHQVSCPVSYLEMCTAPDNHYAYAWRQQVYARAAKLRSMQPGKKVKYGDVVYEIIQRIQGGGFKVTSPSGTVFRMKPKQMACATEVMT